MAKKERFALKLSDGSEVRTLDDLKEHFDIKSVAEHFFDGKLLEWLEDRYYDDEAEEVKQLSSNDNDLAKKLCKIFGVESEEDILRRAERLDKLKTFTDDENIWFNVDKVAFDQEDLADLLDENTREIYLCNNRFSIPLRVKNKSYIGIGNAVAIIRSDKPIDFNSLGIEFKNVTFNPEYLRLLPDKNPPKVSGNTAEVTTTIINRSGIHDRLATNLIKKARSFNSEINLRAKGTLVNAKDMMSLMTIGLDNGSEVTIIAKGNDAKQAVNELKNFIDSGFTT